MVKQKQNFENTMRRSNVNVFSNIYLFLFTGAATVRLGMPAQMESCLIFHYNLKLYDTEADVYDGVSLKRFVMQSVTPPVVSFRVHAPSAGSFLLDIFANAVTPKEYLTGEPMKFKSVCKVSIRKFIFF